MSVIFLLIITIIYFISGTLFLIGLIRRRNFNSREKPFTSVVIAVRNEEKYIKNCLFDLSKQSYPNEQFEIILVDDHSEDNTGKIIKEFPGLGRSNKEPREYIRHDTRGTRNARVARRLSEIEGGWVFK